MQVLHKGTDYFFPPLIISVDMTESTQDGNLAACVSSALCAIEVKVCKQGGGTSPLI
jgi:hypothetical protein